MSAQLLYGERYLSLMGGCQKEEKRTHYLTGCNIVLWQDPDQLTAADVDPQFVRIDTLTRGQVFVRSCSLLGHNICLCYGDCIIAIENVW